MIDDNLLLLSRGDDKHKSGKKASQEALVGQRFASSVTERDSRMSDMYFTGESRRVTLQGGGVWPVYMYMGLTLNQRFRPTPSDQPFVDLLIHVTR